MFRCHRPRRSAATSEWVTDFDQIERNQEIEAEIEKERTRNCFVIKLLLLGPGESGKSTVVKQMKLMHGKMSDMDFKQVKYTIYGNIYTSMANIINAMPKLGIVFEDPQRKDDVEAVFDIIEHHEHFSLLTETVVLALQRLWNDKGIQECYGRRAEYQLNDSAKYFLDQMYDIGKTEYIPSTQDMLCARVKTNGVNEIDFQVDKMTFIITDVGGQKSERRKWIHCFDNVDAVIFVADIGSFNLRLREDNETNRMTDCLLLFSYVCNNKYFKEAAMIVFLNKIDIFSEKLRAGVSIKSVFIDYAGSQDYDECYDSVRTKFVDLNEDRNPQDLHMHPTCSTDTKQVQMILSTCQDMIISKNIGKTSFE